MGYSTEFQGVFNLDKPLTKEHAEYLRAFNYTRRMKRDSKKLRAIDDPKRKAVGLLVGREGEFFVGSEADGNFGQSNDPSVVDHNYPPTTQPGLWCQWEPTEENDGIQWDGGEKFYEYTDWLKYIVKNFLKPWGYVLNGTVRWKGEEFDDIGKLVVKDNVVSEEYPSW